MAGVLRHRACFTSASVIWDNISHLTSICHDQVIWCGRALSGESTSTSTLSRESFQHSPAKLGERHVASTTSRIFTTHAREPPCRRNSDLFRHVFTTTACQGVSAAAVAATTNSDSVKADAGSSSSGGEAGATSKFLAPWPWVDPSRPQVLPISVVKKPRELIPLPEALGHLLDALDTDKHSRANVELFIRFRLDPRRSDHLVRGSVVLPFGTGKVFRLVVFAKGNDADIARSEGADLIGDEELISAIVSGEEAAINFDRLIATPDFMRPLARAGKVLGPKGLMPNPKMGTLTSDVAGAIRDIRRGRLDYRLNREATVRAVIGSVSMTVNQLMANVGALVASLIENRPKVVDGPQGAAPVMVSVAAGAGAAATRPGTAVPTVALLERKLRIVESVARYFMTFLLKTNHSASVHITLQSLLEAATRSHPVAVLPSGGGTSEQQKSPGQAQAKGNAPVQKETK